MVLIYADRKVRLCHWLKFVVSDWSKICLILYEVNPSIDSVDCQCPEFENGFLFFPFADLVTPWV